MFQSPVKAGWNRDLLVSMTDVSISNYINTSPLKGIKQNDKDLINELKDIGKKLDEERLAKPFDHLINILDECISSVNSQKTVPKSKIYKDFTGIL